MASEANPKLCLVKTLPAALVPEASKRALAENPSNAPDGSVLPDGLLNDFLEHPRAMLAQGMPLAAMLYVKKRFPPGRVLKVGFFDTPLATKRLRFRIREKAHELEEYCNLRYEFVGFDAEHADVRINIDRSGGSWSYLGPDIFSLGKGEATMNFGWFDDDTDDEELNRTVKHEFLHNAGLGHEHQNPQGGLRWNVPAVLRHYGGPPNNWSERDVYDQVINPARADQVATTKRDPYSIMHYAVPAELLLDPSQAVGWNTHLSRQDKRFLREHYPYPGQEEAA